MNANGFRSLAIWLMLAVMAVVAYSLFQQNKKAETLDLSRFLELTQAGQMVECVDRGGRIEGTYREKGTEIQKRFETEYLPGQQEYVTKLIVDNKVRFRADPPSTVLMQLISVFLPIVLVVAIMMFVLRQFQSGGAKAMSFGKSRARKIAEGETGVTFADVAGCDEAKEELQEIVEFLKDPQRFTRLGGTIPKGALLVGPPGTGKTLLARAVAGEAKVPFFSISGSDFVEMFVGVGAARVRDLFEQGKKSKPCLIFVDEIDAVGRQRGAGWGGGHDEREQTLNQLLVEMDGFDSNEGVILIAATNRPDVLDSALLRPGRFDRHITVDMPDLRGREAILKIHARNVKLGPDADLFRVARSTPGFSGAHLDNLVNEAALIAARRGKDAIQQNDLEEAKDRVMMGPERRSLVLSDKEKEATAYHEAGHALVACLHPDADPVHKVTIIPRGRALGVTAIHAAEDRHSHSERQLRASLVYALGGRAAELIKFGELSTGASNDLQRVTDLAHRMVCEFGMSEKLGARTFGTPAHEVFLARDYTREPTYSESMAALIDQEINSLIDRAMEMARQLLMEHREAFERVAQALLERESLDGQELQLLIEGKELPPLLSAPDRGASRPAADGRREEKSRKKEAVGELSLDPRPGLSAS